MARRLLLSVLLFTALLLSIDTHAQQTDSLDSAILSIFKTPSTEFLRDLGEVVSEKPVESFGAIERCGEGADEGIHTCVIYYNCDGVTKTIIETGSTDGHGLIDIRFGESTCPHYLDVCCKIPSGGIPPTVTTQKPDTGGVTAREPPTIPPVTPGRGNFCGIRNNNGLDFKITGNNDNEAEYAEFPWMLEILRKMPDGRLQAICGASLITPVAVLTGAHCVVNYKATELRIRAGEWDVQTTKERVPFQERDVVDMIVHPEYVPKTVYNDIALLVLAEAVTKADNIGTICLPPQGAVINSRECYVTGWGQDKFGAVGVPSAILKKIELPMMARDQCQSALRTTRLGKLFTLHESFVCAGGQSGRDACTGDGGAPLVCPDPTNRRRYALTGIVSWGIGCGTDGIPGVYTDVAKFRQWVDNEMNKLTLDATPYIV